MVITRHYLGEWARKKRASEIEKSEPKVYHHGQVYGTKDLKGDKALVGKYKTKEGEMKAPPKGKDEKREMASDLIREHMHHLGRHSGGPKQAIAIALHQAGLSRKKSIDKASPEPVAVPVTSTYKPKAQVHPDVQTAHQHVQDAMGKLQALHEHLSGMAEKWKAEDAETSQKRAGILRRSLEALVEKGHRAFYSHKDAPHRHGGADTPKDAQAAEGGKGHSGFYRRRTPKGERAMMGKGIDVLAEEGRAVARAARKSLETCKGCGKAMDACKCLGKSAIVKIKIIKPQIDDDSQHSKTKKAMEILKATTKMVSRGTRVLPTREETEEEKAKPKVETAGVKVDIPKRPANPMEPGYRPPEKSSEEEDTPLHKLTSRPSSESISRTPPHSTQDRPDLYPRRAAERRLQLRIRAEERRDEGRREVPRDVPHTRPSEPLRVGFGNKLMDALREAKEGSKTKKAIDILKGRMKLETDASGKMTPVATEHAPTMSLEKIESGPKAGQHKMVGPSHFEGGGSSSDKTGPEVISSTPRMHTPGVGKPGGPKVGAPSDKPQYTPGQLHVGASGGSSTPGGHSVIASAPPVKPFKPKTETETALADLKQQKALKSLLEKSPTEMSSNPMHGEPALNPRSEKPATHFALGAAFHERRRDSSPVGSAEWERHDTLASGHAKKLAGVVGGSKAARTAIKQAHETLTGQGASAIKDRHVSPGGGGTQRLPESLLHEREPAWAQPKQSASGVRGKLMASVSGQMDKALEALLSKGGISCPDCGKSISKPNLKRCPHCDTELPQKITAKLNPRWGFRAAGVEKAQPKDAPQVWTTEGEGDKEVLHTFPGHPAGFEGEAARYFKRNAGKDVRIIRTDRPVREKVEKSVATAHGFKEARAMGHSLGEWSDSGRGHAVAHCKNCGEEVHAINNPSNEEGFSLHGGAVSRRCRAGAERTKMKIDDVQERVVNKAAVDPSNPSGPRPETSTPLRVGKPVGTGSYKYAKMDPFGIRSGKTQAPKQEPDKVEKAMSARSVPRMPRALAMQMDTWRNATNVMTRTNSRFSDGYPTAALLPDPTETVPQAAMDSNPVVCKGCGRSYMHKSFPAGCPTCASRKEVPGAWDFVSKATKSPGMQCDHCGQHPESGKLITAGKHQYCESCHGRLQYLSEAKKPERQIRREQAEDEFMGHSR